MNFDYLSAYTDLEPLYASCREAEEFALIKPDISAASARKAMEFIVKTIYRDVDPYPPYGFTVFDMIGDPSFRALFQDPGMLDSMDTIRKTGNAAVHRGSLTKEDALFALEHLHYLVGEYAMSVGLIRDYPEFEIPRPNRIREAMERIHADNFDLDICPYLIEEGHVDWADLLTQKKKRTVAKLYDLPEELNCDAFFGFLEQFERSAQEEVEQLLSLLPRSFATEAEWAARRETLPAAAVARIELFVEGKKHLIGSYLHSWKPYANALGSKAAAYVHLVHPDVLPKQMLVDLVQPDEPDDADEYIPLEEAVKQMFRHIAAVNPLYIRHLLSDVWCRNELGMAFPPLRNNKPSGAMQTELREQFSTERIGLGDKRYYYRRVWDRNALFRLRKLAGEVGENLATEDRMADWGFAVPGSEAEKRAQARAEKRKAAEERAQLEKAAAEQKERKQLAAKAAKKAQGMDVSPNVLREFLTQKISFTAHVQELTSKPLCQKYFGLRHAVLIEAEEGAYLNRKQMSGDPIYYRVGLTYERKEYVLLRMKKDEYDGMKRSAEELGWIIG